MLPIAYYLLKVMICSGILYGYYWLSLRNKVFHKYNRFYLMASIMISMLLPLIKIDLQQQDQQQNSVIRVLQAVSSSDEYMDNIIVTTGGNESFDITRLYPIAYLLVSLILLVAFFHTLFVIFNLLKKYPRQTIDKVSFINTDAKSTPFSFLNYIFWNYNIDVETTTGNQIFKHELAHVQEGHTYDKLFINIVLVFFWCNPFFWLYRKELNMIHEFIADKKAVEDNDTEAFAAMILQATYPQHRFQLTNNFFYSPIKRRLLMLTKNKNPKVNYFGRIMVLPLLALIFAAFALKAKPVSHYYHGKKLTVVIDAGHGGKDGGAKSADGSILEKDITLSLAKAIKALNNNSDIEIVLTKETDIFLTKEQKLEFAKTHNADLYISLHAGATATAADKEYHLGDAMDDKRGLKLLIGNNDSRNSAQSIIFGSALLNEFGSNYELPVMQELVRRTLFTLNNNPCPSVYIETGLVNNKKDVAYLQSAKGKEDIAKNILTAIEKFASTNLQSPVTTTDVFHFAQPNHSMFINTNYSDTSYFKTTAYKTKALVIVDSKEIGNVGMDYVEKSNVEYSSLVTYNPAEAQKKYGEKGKYGVIKLTIKEALCITADSIFYDNKKQTIKLSGTNSSINGNLDKTLIYVDGKEITPLQLNEIKPDKISSINILKGEKLDEIVEEKGKTSVINITLKPADLAEVVVTGKKTDPLYVIDNKIQASEAGLSAIKPESIERVDILKDNAAITKYGVQAQNGVVEITTKAVLSKLNKPILSLGNLTSHTITIEDLNKQTQLNVSDGYSFVSGTVYFGGKGFLQPATVTLSSNSLEPLKSNIERCVDGSAIIFDNVKVKKEGIGTIAIDGHAFTLTNAKGLSRLTTDQPWATAAGLKSTGAGLEEVVVTGYPTRKYVDTLKGLQIDKVFTKTEIAPAYPGGNEAWKNYLTKNLDATVPLKEGWKAGTYTVIVQFIVHTNGTVSDVTTTNYQGSKTAQYCIDLIKKTINWSPAIQNGRAVNAYRKQPITFVIETDKKDITEVYSVPFKAHLMTEGKVNTFHMVSNAKFTAKFKAIFYVNGKFITNPANIKPGIITSIESYDEGAGKLSFGDKGKYGVTLITTKG